MKTPPGGGSAIPVDATITEVIAPVTGYVIVSESYSSFDGLLSWSQSLGVANPSVSQTTLAGNGNWTTTSTSPDGTYTRNTYAGGLMDISENFGSDNTLIASTSMRDSTNAPLSGYDDLIRPTHQRDSRTGVTETEYLSATADVVKSVTAPGNRTTAFTHDHRGRQTAVDAPDTLDAEGATLTNITATAHFSDGTVKETSGAQTYRTTHTYDYAQRMKTLTTYGTATATTTWNYSGDRGFLTRKQYPDGKGTDYTYTPAGRLETRRWARGNWTRYDHDTAGRLQATLYFTPTTTEAFVLATTTIAGNDSTTPDVIVAHDNLGRQKSVTTTVAKSEFTYDPATLALDTETISYNLDAVAGYEFTRVLDRSRDSLNRNNGFELKALTTMGNQVVTTIENASLYGYSPTDGRLSQISNPQIPNQLFAYDYLPNSHLLEKVTGPAHTVTNSYEQNRDVLDLKENKQNNLAGTVISGYDYAVNAIGQRTGVNTSGTAFPNVPAWLWGYDSLGQVTSADSSVPTSDRAYRYDAIGNRLFSEISNTQISNLPAATTTSYTPNVCDDN